MSKWIIYPNGGKGGRSMTGEFVTITPAGNTAISSALTDRFRGHRPGYMRIEISEDRTLLRLTPEETAVDGSLRVMWPGKGRGRQARIGTAGGMRQWGIVPDAVIRCPASWADGSLIVELTKRFVEAAPPRRETPQDRRPAAHRDEPHAAVEPADSQIEEMEAESETVHLCCETCGHATRIKGSARHLCEASASPNRRKLVSPTTLCNAYKPRQAVPPDRPIQSGAVDKRGRPRVTKRALCRECGTEHAVTRNGLFPHDSSGVDYRAGRGDMDDRCPGSNRKV
jgi:hypothetical protein